MEISKQIEIIDAWIDESTSETFRENETLALFGRVTKVMEECGEVMQALIGATGQNPRKGFSHSTGDVIKELADVIVTAYCAIQHITKDRTETMQAVYSKLDFIMERAGLIQEDAPKIVVSLNE
jgi:NTP pyrophosphatase (non-canonical NTP hydrolase)